MNRPAAQRQAAAKPTSAPRLRVARPALSTPAEATTPEPLEGDQLHALVTALLAFVASWRPRLSDPVALIVLRGIEALLGAVRDLADAPGRQLVAVTAGPVVGLQVVTESKWWPQALPDHELRDAIAGRLLTSMEDLSEVDELVEEMSCDADAEIFGSGSSNVTRYTDGLRRRLRYLRGSFAEMSSALLGTQMSDSTVTHARNLARYVDGGAR